MTLPSGHAHYVCNQSLLLRLIRLLVRSLQSKQGTSAYMARSLELLVGKLIGGTVQNYTRLPKTYHSSAFIKAGALFSI